MVALHRTIWLRPERHKLNADFAAQRDQDALNQNSMVQTPNSVAHSQVVWLISKFLQLRPKKYYTYPNIMSWDQIVQLPNRTFQTQLVLHRPEMVHLRHIYSFYRPKYYSSEPR